MAAEIRIQTVDAPRPSRRVGPWRTLVAAPAVVGSQLLLIVLLGGFGGWRLPVLLCWLAAGAALPSPAAERLALLVAAGFRRPSAAQAAALSAPMAAALRRTGTAAGDIQLYVQRRAAPNAYAAGSRAVAVTTGALNHLLAHRLSEDQMVAVLVHDLLTAPVALMQAVPAGRAA